MPRARISATTFSARSLETSGMIRPMASTSTKRRSETRRRSLRSTAVRAMSSSSAMDSEPAYPPPTTMKVSALRFSSSLSVREATSMRSSTQLRTDTASSMVFMPMAFSASPGMGNVRVVEPPAITISS